MGVTCPRCGVHELAEDLAGPSEVDPTQMVCMSCGLHESFEGEFLGSLSGPESWPLLRDTAWENERIMLWGYRVLTAGAGAE